MRCHFCVILFSQPVLEPAEKGRGGDYASTILRKDPTIEVFLAVWSLFLLQYQGGKDMEEDRLPSSYHSTANTCSPGFLHAIEYTWDENSLVSSQK